MESYLDDEEKKESQICFVQLHKLQSLGCSEEGGGREMGATAVKVPSMKKSRTWRNNMSDDLDRQYD